MSWKAAGIVKDINEGISASEKLLLLILADYYNDSTGQCNPAQRTLAKQCLMSPRTLIRALQHLESTGFIKVVRGHGLTHDFNQYDMLCIRQSANLTLSQSAKTASPQSDTSGVKAKVTSPRTKRVATVIKETVIELRNRNKNIYTWEPTISILREIPKWEAKDDEVIDSWLTEHNVDRGRAESTALALASKWEKYKNQNPKLTFMAWVRKPDIANHTESPRSGTDWDKYIEDQQAKS